MNHSTYLTAALNAAQAAGEVIKRLYRRNLGTLVLNGLLSAPSVPPGTYYLRARGRNAAGLSNPSVEVQNRIDWRSCVAGSSGACSASR